MSEQALIGTLQQILGDQYVLTDQQSRVFFSQDIWERGDLASFVIQPANTEQLAQAVAAITTADYSVIGRGGGMSYTKSYTPSEPNTVIIDTGRMNKVLEINKGDMYVTVESGCSWSDLHNALDGTGLRTPYWGTLSGIKATVGGTMSQNGVFWGSGQFGSAVDSVVSLNVVLADGSVLSTGSASQINGSPFFRHFGPDLSGIFCSDSGALGIKATITLRLAPVLPAKEQATFNFETGDKMMEAMAEIARQDLASECFAFDPKVTKLRSGPDKVTNDMKAFFGVLKGSGSIFKAIRDGLKIALAGRRFMKNIQWPMHTLVEQRSDAAVKASLDIIRKIVHQYGGNEIENTIPKIVRANPFGPLNVILGPKGERWAPTHGLVALSKAASTLGDLETIFSKHQAAIDEHDILIGYILISISTNGLVVEPVFFWPEPLNELHEQTIQADFLATLPERPENDAAHAAVAAIKHDVIDYFRDAGAIHLQIGKAYHYSTGLKPEPLKLIEQIKQAVDPKGKINPGVLGLK
jgi:FAD/FMN-containing dehydrogenase